MEDYKLIINKIREIYKQPSGNIALHAPMFIGNEKKYIEECIDSTFVSSVGKFVNIFEEKIAQYTGCEKAVVCVNGTNALYLALKLCGVEPNDEIITQPVTFIATANAISYCMASPIFIDIDKDTIGMSPHALEEFLVTETEIKEEGCFDKKNGRRIKACLPMHTFGHPCKIDQISEICKKYNIELIEDAAESVGSYYKGKHTGTFGEIGVLSFNGNKTITTGGGGMLLFKSDKLANRAKHLTTQAKIPHPWEFKHDEIGYNYRMPNINAALGCAQLENLDFFIERKRFVAQEYSDFFSSRSSDNVTFFREPDHSRSNYWLNSILFDSIKERDKFLEYSNSHDIMTRPLWCLISKLNMFSDCRKGSLNNSEWLEERLVNIPSSVVL